MTLKAILAAGEFDALPDTLTLDKSEVYPRQGDSYRLNVEAVGGVSLEDVGGLRQTAEDRKSKHQRAAADLEKLRAEHEKLQAQLDGLDIEAARRALERPPANKEAAAEIERARKELLDKHALESDQLAKARDAYRRQVEDLMIDSEAARILGDRESGVSGSFALLRAPIRERVRVIEDEETGKLSLAVLGKDGKPMYAPDPKDKSKVREAGMKDLLASLRDESEYSPAFNGIGASGGGATGAGRSVSGKQHAGNMSLPPEDRLTSFWGATNGAGH